MDYTKYVTDGQVLSGCEAEDKPSLIRALVEAASRGPLFAANPGLTIEAVEQALLAREAERPTVLAPGVACPHARMPGLTGAGGAAAILKHPFAYGSADEAPVKIAVVLIVPAERPPLALRLLANVARLGADNIFQQIVSADPAAAAALIRKHVFVVDAPLLARDVMRPVMGEITTGMSVTEVARKMALFNLDAVGILSEDGRLVGEITSDALYTSGMPEFFSQLKSVSFIKEFDPFDGYFDRVAHQTAGEVMSTNVARVPEDATMLEVIFLLSVKRHAKVYVERDGKLAGVIDRARVLNEIINP